MQAFVPPVARAQDGKQPCPGGADVQHRCQGKCPGGRRHRRRGGQGVHARGQGVEGRGSRLHRGGVGRRQVVGGGQSVGGVGGGYSGYSGGRRRRGRAAATAVWRGVGGQGEGEGQHFADGAGHVEHLVCEGER